MRQPKKVKKSVIKSFRIWLEKKIGLRCPECGGKTSFHHYKRCSKYNKEPVFDPLKNVKLAEELIKETTPVCPIEGEN
jgi:hypothetical protein